MKGVGPRWLDAQYLSADRFGFREPAFSLEADCVSEIHWHDRPRGSELGQRISGMYPEAV